MIVQGSDTLVQITVKQMQLLNRISIELEVCKEYSDSLESDRKALKTVVVKLEDLTASLIKEGHIKDEQVKVSEEFINNLIKEQERQLRKTIRQRDIAIVGAALAGAVVVVVTVIAAIK